VHDPPALMVVPPLNTSTSPKCNASLSIDTFRRQLKSNYLLVPVIALTISVSLNDDSEFVHCQCHVNYVTLNKIKILLLFHNLTESPLNLVFFILFKAMAKRLVNTC